MPQNLDQSFQDRVHSSGIRLWFHLLCSSHASLYHSGVPANSCLPTYWAVTWEINENNKYFQKHPPTNSKRVPGTGQSVWENNNLMKAHNFTTTTILCWILITEIVFRLFLLFVVSQKCISAYARYNNIVGDIIEKSWEPVRRVKMVSVVPSRIGAVYPTTAASDNGDQERDANTQLLELDKGR